MTFSPDGRILAGGGSTIILWDATSGEERARLAGGRSVWDLAFSPDGKRLFSVGDVVKVWDLATGEEEVVLARSTSRSIAVSPDGKTLAIAGDPVRLWDLTTRESAALEGHEAPSSCVAFSPDGKILASVARRSQNVGDLKLWDVGTRKELASFSPRSGRLRGQPTS